MSEIYLEEKQVIVKIKKDDPNSAGKEFYISKVPAILGREIVFKYPPVFMSFMGKSITNEDYLTGEEIMRKVLRYVRVKLADGRMQALDSDLMINNHVPNGEMLLAIEKEMMRYNFSFFKDGEASDS